MHISNEISDREIALRKTEPAHEVVRIQAGGQFGELALINDDVRAATIECTEDCIFLVIRKMEYKELMMRAEKKQQEKLIEFLRNIPYLQSFPPILATKLQF